MIDIGVLKMSNPVKVGILGLGRAGYGMHVNELNLHKDEFKIIAGCDIEQDHCDAFNEKVGGCATYLDIKDFLANDEIELVSVATRSTQHGEHAKMCLEAGKTVFVEKPVAVTWDDLALLGELIEKYPGKIFFRHNRRFEAAFMQVRAIIASGVLGEVYEIKLRRNSYQRRNDWQTIIECGGGQLNNWGPHIIDHSLRLLESEPAEIWRKLNVIAAAGDAEDCLKIVFTGKNGRIVDMEINGAAALPEPEYIVSGCKGMLICENNVIRMKYIDPDQKLIEIKSDPGTPPISGPFGNAEQLVWIEREEAVVPVGKENIYSIWKYLYGTIREGKPFPITSEEAMGVARTVLEIKKGSGFEK